MLARRTETHRRARRSRSCARPGRGWWLGGTNGGHQRIHPDLDGRLTGISTTVPSSSALIQSLAYGFDANDTITAISNGANASLTQSFGYDELTRLTGVTSSSGNWAWGYDGNGNRSSQTSSYGSAAYSVAAASNQYLAVSGANGRSFGFDALGNRISDTGAGGTLSLHYDAFNRMDRSTWAGVTTSYHVNPLGQRTTKSTPGGNWTRFVYAADGSLLTERGPAGMTDYLWLGGTLVGMVRNNVLYAIHTDHLGRPEMVTNPTQAIVWRANNYAFHRDVAQDNIGGLNLGFPGQYFDAETGLWNNGFRDYDSSMGVYVESDPIGLAGGINTYAYVGGNPGNRADFLGLCPIDCNTKLPDGKTPRCHDSCPLG